MYYTIIDNYKSKVRCNTVFILWQFTRKHLRGYYNSISCCQVHQLRIVINYTDTCNLIRTFKSLNSYVLKYLILFQFWGFIYCLSVTVSHGLLNLIWSASVNNARDWLNWFASADLSMARIPRMLYVYMYHAFHSNNISQFVYDVT